MTDQRPIPPYVGCTDGGCVFGHPGGMYTNGGCKCLDELRELYGADADGLYARVRSALLRLRMRLERAEAGVKAVTGWIAVMGCTCDGEIEDPRGHDAECPGWVEFTLRQAKALPDD